MSPRYVHDKFRAHPVSLSNTTSSQNRTENLNGCKPKQGPVPTKHGKPARLRDKYTTLVTVKCEAAHRQGNVVFTSRRLFLWPTKMRRHIACRHSLATRVARNPNPSRHKSRGTTVLRDTSREEPPSLAIRVARNHRRIITTRQSSRLRISKLTPVYNKHALGYDIARS